MQQTTHRVLSCVLTWVQGHTCVNVGQIISSILMDTRVLVSDTLSIKYHSMDEEISWSQGFKNCIFKLNCLHEIDKWSQMEMGNIEKLNVQIQKNTWGGEWLKQEEPIFYFQNRTISPFWLLDTYASKIAKLAELQAWTSRSCKCLLFLKHRCLVTLIIIK